MPYLRIVGHLVFAWLWARMAALSHGHDDAFHRAKWATARFYYARLLPEAAMRAREALAEAAVLMSEDAFG